MEGGGVEYPPVSISPELGQLVYAAVTDFFTWVLGIKASVASTFTKLSPHSPKHYHLVLAGAVQAIYILLP